MKIAYGYDGIDEDDDLFEVATEAAHTFLMTAIPGVWLVDQIPMRSSPLLLVSMT